MTTTATHPSTTTRQRGRSEIGYTAAMSAFANGRLRDAARERYESLAGDARAPQDYESRIAAVKGLADTIKEWRFDQLYMRHVAESVFVITTVAGVETAGVRPAGPDDVSPVARDPDLEIPEYYSSVNFHLAPWYDESPKYVIVAPTSLSSKISDRAGVAAVPIGSDLTAQRESVVAQVTTTPATVLDLGSGGSGHFIAKVQDRFPDAEIHGVDLSSQFLRGPAALSAARGDSWTLSNQNAEHTDYPDESFDLVTSYALFHELPVAAAANVMREAYRVLKPGGEMLMGDVPPYRQIPDFQFLVYDWETEGREEPYWREQGLLDRGELCRSVGFDNVEEYSIGPTDYPWVLRARKPR